MKNLLVIFLCFSVFKIATCANSEANRKCYVCTASEKDQKCGDQFVKADHSLDICDTPKSFCLKQRIHPSEKVSGDNVQRACVEEKYCELQDNKMLFCEVCNEDGCNSSNSLLPSCIVISITTFFIKYLL